MKTSAKLVAASLPSAAAGFSAGRDLPLQHKPAVLPPPHQPVAAASPASGIAITPLPPAGKPTPQAAPSGTPALTLQRIALDMKGNKAQVS